MSDVFISYKREDLPAIERLARALTELDLDVWFDASLEVGEAWERRILTQAEEAKAILACWTEASCQSEWVRREAEIGVRRGVLAPVKLTACDPPFADLHICDLRSWRGDFDAPAFQGLLGRLEHLTGHPNLSRMARSRAGGQRGDIVALLRQLLVARAFAGLEPLTYRQALGALARVARARGVDLEGFDQPALWGALDAITEQNRSRREPPLAALVVSVETGLPGRGYFQRNAFLRSGEEEIARAVWEQHVAEVRAYGWQQDV